LEATFHYRYSELENGIVPMGTKLYPYATWSQLKNAVENSIADEIKIIIHDNLSAGKVSESIIIPSNVTKLTITGFDGGVGMLDLHFEVSAAFVLNPVNNTKIIINSTFFKAAYNTGTPYTSSVFEVMNADVNYDIDFINSFLITGIAGSNELTMVTSDAGVGDFETSHCNVRYLGCSFNGFDMILNACTGSGSTTTVYDAIFRNTTSPITGANLIIDHSEFELADPGFDPSEIGADVIFSASFLSAYDLTGIAASGASIETAYYKKITLFTTTLSGEILIDIAGNTRLGPGAFYYSGARIYVDLTKASNGSGSQYDPWSGDQFIDLAGVNAPSTHPYAAVFKIKGLKEMGSVQGCLLIGIADQNYMTFESWDLQKHGPWGLILTGVVTLCGALRITFPTSADIVDIKDFILISNTPDANFNIYPCESSSGSGKIRFLNTNIHCNLFTIGGTPVRAGHIDLSHSYHDIEFAGSIISSNKLTSGGALTANHLIKDSITNISTYEAA